MARPRIPEHRRKHGTTRTLSEHYKRGEKPCPECKALEKRKNQERWKRHQAQRKRIINVFAERRPDMKKRLTMAEWSTLTKLMYRVLTREEQKELGLDITSPLKGRPREW